MAGRFPYIASPTGRALSLLSSKASVAADSWVSASDLSSRCSDALRELIVENRTATILARHFVVDPDYWHSSHHVMDQDPAGECQQTQTGLSNSFISHQTQMQLTEPHGWARLQETSDTHVTLDLMQAPSGQFELLSLKGKAKEEEEECSELWNSFEGSGNVG
uniref:Squamosa promoter binding-like protein n=1 Tax=Litchi chinensis TaxID=151069 RepID=A0A2R4K350_LITCN|nr:squamosa promoter binding-like protein [Litchi chinensis]